MYIRSDKVKTTINSNEGTYTKSQRGIGNH